jgi:hypothetical protein
VVRAGACPNPGASARCERPGSRRSSR